MEFDREWIVPLEREDARILVRHGGKPMTSYAAMLQLLRDGRVAHDSADRQRP
jgi:hypothetical protein